MSGRVFGATLALAGLHAEMQAAKPEHCEEGCMGCQLEEYFAFSDWLTATANQQAASAVHEHVRSTSDDEHFRFNTFPRIP